MNATYTTRWTTVCTMGYTGSVSRNENRAAHGGVCHIQVRRGENGLLARKVNTNGRHTEESQSFAPTADEVTHWERIGRKQ